MTMFLLSDRLNESFRAQLTKSSRGYDEIAAMRGEQTGPADLRFEWKMGSRRPAELVWTDGMGLLASTTFLTAIRDLTGWSAVPVSLGLPSGETVDSYRRLVIAGRCGSFQAHRTDKLPADSKTAWDMYKALCFAPGEESADICMPRELLSFIFVGAAFADVVAALASDVAEIMPCEDVLTQPWTYLAVMEKVAPRDPGTSS